MMNVQHGLHGLGGGKWPISSAERKDESIGGKVVLEKEYPWPRVDHDMI